MEGGEGERVSGEQAPHGHFHFHVHYHTWTRAVATCHAYRQREREREREREISDQRDADLCTCVCVLYRVHARTGSRVHVLYAFCIHMICSIIPDIIIPTE